MEEAVCAQEALAGAHQAHLPALQRALDEGAIGQDEPAQLLLRTMPGAVQVVVIAGVTHYCPEIPPGLGLALSPACLVGGEAACGRGPPWMPDRVRHDKSFLSQLFQ